MRTAKISIAVLYLTPDDCLVYMATGHDDIHPIRPSPSAATSNLLVVGPGLKISDVWTVEGDGQERVVLRDHEHSA